MRFASSISNLALVLALVFAPGCGRDEAPAASASSGGEAGAARAPFVWRVDGGTGPSYLLGTIHVAVPLRDALPSELMPTLESARVVMLEIDASSQAVTPEEIARHGMIQAGPTLEQRLTPTQWNSLVTELQPLGFPAAALAQMRPWLPAMTLLIARTSALPDASATVGPNGQPIPMDSEVLNSARERNAALRFLETPGEQLALLSGIGEEPMTEWLIEMIDQPEKAEAQLRKMIAAYRAGDAAALEEVVFDEEELAEHPEYHEALFTTRNRAWVPALREELARGGAFVAVGVGHFLGPDGLVALLAREGLTLERLPAR
ncbi:MAG: TraB/GumN family protein [Polyangiaceae bacterium]|nr:TraB/GumN family protein [Polyangiaceae bacterium]